MNKKMICPICKRKLRVRSFVWNPLVKEKVCKQCDRRIGHNKFYINPIDKKDYIGKYTINSLEKKRLFQKYRRMGNTVKNSWRLVRRRINQLKGVKRASHYYKRKQELKEDKIKQKERELNLKLIEGLK